MASKNTALKRLGATSAKAATGVVKTLSDPKKTKRMLAVGKVVVPILTPIALKAVDAMRTAADDNRARRLGVNVADLGAYRGPTGQTRARLHAVQKAVIQLRERRTGDPEVIRFTDSAVSTLNDLDVALDAAAPMPPSRRRPTIAAVNSQLSTLESEVVARLVRATL